MRAWDTRAWVQKIPSPSPGKLKRVAMTRGSTRTFLSLQGAKINDFNMVLIDRQH
jgi:hypothetical protein